MLIVLITQMNIKINAKILIKNTNGFVLIVLVIVKNIMNVKNIYVPSHHVLKEYVKIFLDVFKNQSLNNFFIF